MENTQSGSGVQNNHYAQNQYINYGKNQNVGGNQNDGREVVDPGREFVRSFTMAASNPHKHLWEAISEVGASHTDTQQIQRGSCLLGTREKHLDEIRTWAAAAEQDRPIYWLSGPAGVGKSAIAMTIAKWCAEQERLVSSFFFFRSDQKRNNPAALIPTIARGLVSTIPSTRSLIEQKISKDPKILKAEIEEQFSELVLEPARRWSWQRWLWAFFAVSSLVVQPEATPIPPPKVPNIVIIDGLDEAGDEETQLRIIYTILSAFQDTNFPLRFLICSRPEAWLQDAFDDGLLRQCAKRVVVDESGRDIRLFFVDEFAKISSHPKYKGHVQFPDPWPSKKDLNTLVVRSSHQFIYAKTTVQYIKTPDTHPATQLRSILEIAPKHQTGDSPYRNLDELYDFIVRANKHRDTVLLILAALLILPPHLPTSPACIDLVLGLEPGTAAISLRPMYSVLDVRGPNDVIRIYHTSFSDYLLDHNRSGDFYIDEPAQKLAIAKRWLHNLSTSKVGTYSFDQLCDIQTRHFFTQWIPLCSSVPKPTRDLLEDLRNVDLAYVFFCKHATPSRFSPAHVREVNSTQTGPGTQSNHQAQVQNINYGRDQNIGGGESVDLGREFLRRFTTATANPHRSLWDAVLGIGASHHAEQQQQIVRGYCLPGTREKVLGAIREWTLAGDQGIPICLLAGPAGAGKSFIAMTIAESCEEEGLLASSFFFFRYDSKRNNPDALVLTIAHGLVSTIPLLRSHIEERISRDPTILEAGLEAQFRELVFQPLLIYKRLLDRADKSSSEREIPRIAIIDGLDECGGEGIQLCILSTIRAAFEHTPHLPLRFLICSRPEAWVQEAFDDEHLRQRSRLVNLDDSHERDNGLAQYFLHHFREISIDPKYCHVPFPEPWPSEEELNTLVIRSSYQFIYAVTAIMFIQTPDTNPITQLQSVLETAPKGRKGGSPYRGLDALFHCILHANQDHEIVLLILAALLILPPHDLPASSAFIELVLGLPKGQAPLSLRAMRSVLNVRGPDDDIHIHCTSFRDYLLDQERSGDSYIDIPVQKLEIARRWLLNLSTQKMKSSNIEQLYDERSNNFFGAWMMFCASIPKPTQDLLKALRGVDSASAFFWDHITQWHQRKCPEFNVQALMPEVIVD
ncbi:hypothetical protein PQX77_011840 [Marasmius sp. AFHP31]|nr:hypothetical protein PQX77_011840 [Marasmius sp. AFHP31]